MKKQTFSILVPMVVFMLAPCTLEPAFANSIKPAQYYTWGISNSDVIIPQGNIVTEAVLTIHNVTNIAENENDALYIHLLDNPPLGFVSNNDYGSGDFFENLGVLLNPVYHDQAAGIENLVYTFSTLNDGSSPLWDIFNPDGSNMDGFSSTLLQLIDYAGNSTPFGFGFDPNGISNYSFETITLELTVDSFSGPASPYLLTFTTSLFEPIGNKSIDEDLTLTFDVITQDPNTVVSAQPLPAGASFSNNTFTWTPDHDQAGTYDIEFSASDGDYENIEIVTITVNNIPILASIQILGPTTVNENSTGSYTCTATYDDSSTSTVTATWIENSSYTTINSNGVLTAGDVLADQQCTITASYSGLTDTHDVTITYMPEITALTISGPAQVHENSTGSYTCTATYDDSSTSTVTATWIENSSYTTINSNGVLTAGDVLADQQCTITASYGGLTDTHDVTITYMPEITALTISGPAQVHENSTGSYTCTATYDDSSTSTVTATWNEDSSYASIDGNGNLTTGLVISDQPCQITTTYQIQTATYDVTIVNVLVPPVLAPIGNKSVKEGKTLTFTISATDPDSSTITYSADNLPAGAELNGDTFTWMPWYSQAGTYQVAFRASDGQLEDSETITITVMDVQISDWYSKWLERLGLL